MGKGSNTTSTSSTSSADPQAAALYRDILTRAQGVASTPYQAYTGELTAANNAQQNLGVAGINANAGYASPYISQAAQQATQYSAPISGSDISNYLNPYTQNVVDATTAQLQHDFGQQNAQLQGNQIAQGALGGNATGVAKAILAGQQGRQLASTTAGLYQQGYQQAVDAAQRQQQTGLAGANAIANYGISGQNAALQGASAQFGVGTQQQQTEQARLDALYRQYAQQQAYPYQQTQWLAGLGTGVGSNLGGTSSGSTTAPQPNQAAQWLGAGISAAGLFLNRGGAVHGGVDIPHMAGGGSGGISGTPWSDAQGWIPQINIHGGSGAPHASAPGLPSTPSFDASKLASGVAGLGQGDWKHDWSGGLGSLQSGSGLSGDSWGGGSFWGGDAYGGSSASPTPGIDPSEYGEGFAGGGGVAGPRMHFADGGSPTFDERYGDDMRELGHDLARRDVGNRLIPSGVINPDDPIRLDSSATDEWRKSTPTRGVEAPPVAAADDDPEELPPTATPTQGGPQGVAGAPPMYQPPGPPEPRRGFGLGLISPNAKTGLLTAGLGMLASRSPFLGNAIGEGGLAGVSAYGAAEEHDRKVAAEAEKLSREANQTAYERWMGNRKQSETERHNAVTEKREAEKGFKPTWGVVDEDPITNRKIYGWIDPNTKTTARPPAKEGDRAAIPASAVGDDYMKELEQRNPEMARTVKAVANYQANLASLSQRGGMREKILEHVMRYNPEFDQTQFGAKQQAVKAFAAGPEGRAVRSLNVSIDHLDTLREAADAMKNGNLPMLNKLVNTIREKTGSPLTTNFDSIKQVVSAEIAKAVVGGQTALHDRDDMARRAANSQSPDQLNGIITQFQKLMAGQMKGLRRAYETTTRLKNFDDYMEPRTREILSSVSHSTESEGAKTEGGAKFTPPPGAIPRLYNGKTYYYDPNTKQPYPGQ